jgi:hypothetical protein
MKCALRQRDSFKWAQPVVKVAVQMGSRQADDLFVGFNKLKNTTLALHDFHQTFAACMRRSSQRRFKNSEDCEWPLGRDITE